MNRNNEIDRATRKANAQAMRLSRDAWLLPLRIMNTPALASTPSTSTRVMTMTVFMVRDYRGALIGILQSALTTQ